jgi:hypothetical protein
MDPAAEEGESARKEHRVAGSLLLQNAGRIAALHPRVLLLAILAVSMSCECRTPRAARTEPLVQIPPYSSTMISNPP